MIDAYEIGIQLALQDEVSSGLEVIGRELAELDKAVAASSAGLAALTQAAQGAARAVAAAANLRVLAPAEAGEQSSPSSPHPSAARASAPTGHEEGAAATSVSPTPERVSPENRPTKAPEVQSAPTIGEQRRPTPTAAPESAQARLWLKAALRPLWCSKRSGWNPLQLSSVQAGDPARLGRARLLARRLGRLWTEAVR